jgi:hypothetical protein
MLSVDRVTLNQEQYNIYMKYLFGPKDAIIDEKIGRVYYIIDGVSFYRKQRNIVYRYKGMCDINMISETPRQGFPI